MRKLVVMIAVAIAVIGAAVALLLEVRDDAPPSPSIAPRADRPASTTPRSTPRSPIDPRAAAARVDDAPGAAAVDDPLAPPPPSSSPPVNLTPGPAHITASPLDPRIRAADGLRLIDAQIAAMEDEVAAAKADGDDARAAELQERLDRARKVRARRSAALGDDAIPPAP